jgi:hypothetical protein
MVEEYKPDVVCLSETWAKPKDMCDMMGYETFEVASGNKGGAMLWVKSELKPKHHATISMAGGQGVLARVSGGLVGALYAPPRATMEELSAFIMRVKNYPGALLLAGDWNSRAIEWGDIPSARGNCLRGARGLRIHAALHNSFFSYRNGSSNIDLVATSGGVVVMGVPECLPPRWKTGEGHRPLLSKIRWCSVWNGQEYRIRPTILEDQKRRDRAAEYYADHLPDVANAMEMIRNEEDMNIWYQLLTKTLREPFVEE